MKPSGGFDSVRKRACIMILPEGVSPTEVAVGSIAAMGKDSANLDPRARKWPNEAPDSAPIWLLPSRIDRQLGPLGVRLRRARDASVTAAAAAAAGLDGLRDQLGSKLRNGAVRTICFHPGDVLGHGWLPTLFDGFRSRSR